MKAADLYGFQRKGVLGVETFNGRALLADDMGLGKTIQAAYWMDNYYEWLYERPAIVVCPASVKYNWRRELSKRFDIKSTIISGRQPEALESKRPVFIINYDILAWWAEYIRMLEPGLIIFDECHYLGNRNTKRTKSAKRLAKGVEYIIGTSGTPLTNRPSELWPFLNICRPDLYPSFYAYAVQYCDPRRGPWGTTYKGATNIPRLHRELKRNVMIRRLKSQVLTELPEKTRSVILMDIPNRKEYDAAVAEYVKWYYANKGRTGDSDIEFARMTKMNELKRLVGPVKLESTIKWVEDFLLESSGKLILFGVHKKVIRPLYEKFRKVAVKVDGSVTGKKRQDCFDKFTENASTRLFIGNIRAAGTGWNGTAASTVAFCELDWTPGIHTQAEDRIHRIGQKTGAMVYYLIARNTVEEDLCNVLQKKQEVITGTLDGRNQKNELSIYDQVERMLIFSKGKKK